MINTFWNRVEFSDQCWEWIGCRNNGGYGKFNLNGKSITAHRFSYEQIKGKIPKGLQLDHLCRNRVCVNPNHLEAVTNKENILRGDGPTAINARKTHCVRGHELKKPNIYVTAFSRYCKICQKEYRQENKTHILEYLKVYRQKNKARIKEQQKRSYQRRKKHLKKFKEVDG